MVRQVRGHGGAGAAAHALPGAAAAAHARRGRRRAAAPARPTHAVIQILTANL